MCDTMVALGSAVAGGGALFAKNSDRQPNEAQNLELVPRRRHKAGATVKLTYIEVPQVRETNAVLLSRPFWIWGAEMGANEHGVVIGNEAVFARVPSGRKPGMIGMDLLRLGLERGASARDALDAMLELLEAHGQSGNCGHRKRQFYDNSFIIADRREAFVLETFARHYAVEQVRGIRTISNALSIGTDHISHSEGLEALARAKGWYRGNGHIDFAASFADPVREAPGQGRMRCARSTDVLRGHNARLRTADMKSVLRDHGGGDDWRPDVGTGRTICMHAHPAIGRRGQTTAAMVSELNGEASVHWVTGAAAPCTAVFRPVMLQHGLPDRLRKATDRFDPKARWWKHELLHRAVLQDYDARHGAIAAERDALEHDMRKRMVAAMKDTSPGAAVMQRGTIEECWREADDAEARWLDEVGAMPVTVAPAQSYRRAWARLGAIAEMTAATPKKRGAVQRKRRSSHERTHRQR